jgi:hypothetical protein
MNDKTKTAPFFCHEPVVTLVDGLARPVGVSIDSDAQKVFYTEDDQQSGDTDWPLSVVNVDGSNKKSVVPKLLDPQGIDLDVQAQKVYYTEHHGQRVGVVNYDGSDQKILHTFSGDQLFPSDIVVDPINGYLFVQVETALSTGGQLVRMKLDGSEPTVIVKDITRAYGITVNPKTKVAYYVSGGHGGFISNVSYDGTNQGTVLGGLEWPFEIDIDATMERLVFSSTGVGDGKIQTIKFDGTDVQDIQELGFAPMGVSFGKVPTPSQTELMVSSASSSYVHQIVTSPGDHCLEVMIPGGDQSPFWKSEGWKYSAPDRPEWKTGACDRTKWHTVDATTKDYDGYTSAKNSPYGAVVLHKYGLGNQFAGMVLSTDVDCRTNMSSIPISIEFDNLSEKVVRIRGCQNQYACKPFKDCVVGMADGAKTAVTLDSSFKYVIITYQGDARDTELYPDANMKYPSSYDIKAPTLEAVH